MIRWTVRIVLGLALLAVLCAGAWWAVNATDEELTAEARELLQPPVLEAPGADNAWQAGVAFLDRPENTPREGWLRWHSLNEPFLGKAGEIQPTLQSILIVRAPLYAEYRRLRALPRYGETEWPSDPMARVPLDGALNEGGGLALAQTALAALDGRLEDAVAELEKEAAYHRRALAGSRTLLGNLIAATAILRDAVMTSELVERHGEKLRPYRERLARVVAPLPREDLDLSAVYENEDRFTAQAFLRYRDVILNQNKAFNEYRPEPLHAWQAFGYRKHATVNEFARRREAYRRFLNASYEQAWAGRDFPELPERRGQSSWRIVNPTGYVMVDREVWSGATYHRHMKDFSALVALVGLQVALTLDERKRSAFLGSVAADGIVVLDEPFRSRATFDRGSSSIRYKPLARDGAIGAVAKRFGGEFVVPAGLRREAK